MRYLLKETILPFALVAGAIIAALGIVPLVYADSAAVDFESPTYSLGSPHGQDGWSKSGPYDSEIVSNTYGFGSFESQTLRISNAVTSGSFGDHLFSKSLADEAGETDAQNGGLSGGTRMDHFEASFDIASTDTDEQPGLFMQVSPDRGDGARMSYVGFDDEPDGIHVIFYDYQDMVPYGTLSTPADGCGVGGDTWILDDVATIDRTSPHNIKITMDFVDGPRNDIVKVFVDDVLVKTGTSWEDYFRWCTESGGGVVDDPVADASRTVDSIAFFTRGTAAPATAGNGYLIDNVMLESSENIYQPTGEILTPTANEVVAPGLYEFTATYDDGDAVNDDAVQWAVREGTCAMGVGTVFGNVDGHNDPYSWDGMAFSTTLDLSSLTPGEHCFIFNPTDDPGQNNVRETQLFVVDSPVLPDVKVTIKKYIGDSVATAAGTDSASFPMKSSWDADNIGAGSGSYALSPTGFNSPDPYTAVTSDMSSGADYSTYEDLTTPVVGASCEDGKPYALAGYSVGDTLLEAEGATPSLTPPSFTGLTSDKFVIVWNTDCTPPPPSNACDTPDVAPEGYTLLEGTPGFDKVTLLLPQTMFVGLGGNDKVTAGDGNYIICLGVGNAKVTVGNGEAVIVAEGGNTKIETGDGEALIITGDGNDKIYPGNGVHTIYAGEGNNTIETGNGNKTIVTGGGNDKIKTGDGDDSIDAGEGNNKVNSGAGNDTITSGASNDKIDGGSGAGDTCDAGAGFNNVQNCEF